MSASEHAETIFTVTDLSVHFEQKNGLFRRKKVVFKAVDNLSFQFAARKNFSFSW